MEDERTYAGRIASNILEVASIPLTAGYHLSQFGSGKKSSFLEDIVGSASAFTLVPMEVGVALAWNPSLALTGMGVANVGGGLYGLVRRVKNRKNEEVEKSKISFKEKAKKFVRNSLKKGTAIGLGWVLASGLAEGHYQLTKDFPAKEKLENVHARAYRLETGDSSHDFVLLGEFHYYNESSNNYVCDILDSGKIGVLLGEGVEGNVKAGPFPWSIEKPLRLGGKLKSFGPIMECKKRDIPRVGLEKIDRETGCREGLPKVPVSPKALSLGGNVLDPLVYSLGIPFRHMRFDYVGKSFDCGNNRILDFFNKDRNELMVGRVVDYMCANPEKVPLMQVGMTHVPGVLEEFKGYGSLREISFDEISKNKIKRRN